VRCTQIYVFKGQTSHSVVILKCCPFAIYLEGVERRSVKMVMQLVQVSACSCPNDERKIRICIDYYMLSCLGLSYSVGTAGPCPGSEGLGRETVHLPPRSPEVMNTWIYTSAPLYVFVAFCLIKHTNKFTLRTS
jgi:hypothetical protein